MKSVMNLWLPCVLLSAIHLTAAVALVDKSVSLQLRRSPLRKAKQPGYYTEPDDSTKVNPDDPAVVKVEKKLRRHHKNVMTKIDAFRAEVCAKMKNDFGVSFETFRACHKFMKKTCKPGEDMRMDGDHHEVSSGEGYCREYFPEAEEKAEKEVTKEEEEEASVAGSPYPGPGPSPGPAPAPQPAPAAGNSAPAPAPKASAGAPASGKGSPGPAPMPGPMGMPSPMPAPVPAPFIPGISAGKPWGPISKDEAWYYAGGGKDDGRMHMSESMKLPTQGYWGKLVEHEDGETQTSDWQKEFGPNSGHDSLQKVCKEHPENEWCMRRGYGRTFKSSAPAVFAHLVPVVMVVLATAGFW